MPGKVPDRWEDYIPFKHPVKGTRFIAFKVPLEQGICQRLPADQWFTPEKLIKGLEAQKFRLGLVIDLTNTKRYYKPSEIEVHGVGFIKINTEGRVVPSVIVQKKFHAIVDDFLERNVGNDLLIGVHCTHGLNRTGYMVCRYMIDRMRFAPKEAIEAFNEARGYSMERENYITDLMNSDRDEPLPVDNTSDGEIVEDEDSETGITAFRTKPPGDATVTTPTTPGAPTPGESPGGNMQHTGFRGRGFQRRGFQNYNQGQRGGFQRRPFNNRGFQNNYNRGGRGFQNFQDRGRGDFRGRGNFRGNWNHDQRGGFSGAGRGGFNPYETPDLDEDTEVIITKSERGTIIREERSASQAQKLREQEAFRNRRKSYHDEDDGYGGRSSGRQQYRDDYRDGGGAWESERSPPRKAYRTYDEDDERDSYRSGRGGFRGRGSFDGERRGCGSFRKHEESYHKRGYEEVRQSYGYGQGEAEGGHYSKYERGFSPPATRDRSWSPEDPGFRSKESQRFRGRGTGEGFRSRGEGRGFSRGEGRGGYRGRGEGRGGYKNREEAMDYEEHTERRHFEGRTQEREFEGRESRSFRGRGEGREFRGRGEGVSRGFGGRGRGRDSSPGFREAEERPVYKGRERMEAYEEDAPPRFKEKERPVYRQREESPELRERSSSFRGGSPSPGSFRKKTPGSKYSRDNSPPGFESDISDDSFKGQFEEVTFQKAERGRPQRGAYQGRGTEKAFKARSREFHEEASSPPRARARRMTPPAQYRDTEPSPPPFKRRERSPAFRDDSPEPNFREESFKNRSEVGFRGRGREEGFRGRGRGENQSFRGRGASFQKTRGSFKQRASSDWD